MGIGNWESNKKKDQFRKKKNMKRLKKNINPRIYIKKNGVEKFLCT